MATKKPSRKNETLENAACEFCANGSEEAKVTVIKAGEALVNYYAGLYSSGETDEDLLQVGYEGLLKALLRFDPDKGVMFSTYAVHCIIGEIRHELRDRGPFKIPEWLQSLQGKVLKATEELAQKNGYMPTLTEIAQKANVTEEGIIEAMQVGSLPLEEIDLSKLRSLRYESFKLPLEDVVTLKMSLDKMDSLQKQVITMIYFDGMTQEQVAKKLGLNQRKVSHILNSGLKQMRFEMA
ncbi:MAG: sigma-70 family RNA polymerase sigma factor [Bacillota bacterium]